MQLPVSSGALDFNGIYESCKNTAEWIVAEFDEYEVIFLKELKQATNI